MERSKELNAFDSFLFAQEYVLRLAFIFTGKISELNMKNALTQVIQEHYPIYGCRLKKKAGGLFEYVIPKEYNEVTRPFEYECIDKSIKSLGADMDISKFPTAKTSDAAQSVILNDIPDYSKVFTFKETGKKSYLNRERSMLGLYITKYSDYTAVLVTASHMLCDAHGLRLLLTAWQDVLNSRPVTALNEELVLPKFEGQKPIHVPMKPLTTWQQIAFVARFLWQMFRNGNPIPKRIIVSKEKMEKIREGAQALTNKYPISRWDILLALSTKLSAVGRAGNEFDKMFVSSVIGLRSRVKNCDNYPHNLLLNIPDKLSSKEIAELSFYELIVRLKSFTATMTNSSEELMKIVNTMEASKPRPVYRYPCNFILAATHWGSFKFLNLDLGAATEVAEPDNDKAGKVIAFDPLMDMSAVTDAAYVLFDDGPFGQGGAMLNHVMFEHCWGTAERELNGIVHFIESIGEK
ncbi:hypothetical protein V1517DRAFT_76044 [Lipomyces orientalis]|uniref:Uncharacterized protein n=1 Tax=Lipomyces orientalis TaxID=1233043 RepID=A0ACC3TDK6_9ASCO